MKDLTTTRLLPATAQKPRLSRRMRLVLDLLISGECKTVKAAAIRANLHPDHAGRELRKPHVMGEMDALIRQHLAAGTLRASSKLRELIDSTSQKVSMEATSLALRVGGYVPTERSGSLVSVNVNSEPGYVIKLMSDGGRSDDEGVSFTSDAGRVERAPSAPLTIEHDSGNTER